MRIYCDTADLNEIERMSHHAWVSGFTTNPTLYKQLELEMPYGRWAQSAVLLAMGKPVSIDGPPEKVWDLGGVAKVPMNQWQVVKGRKEYQPVNFTAVCHESQIPGVIPGTTQINYYQDDIISVFAGRIMDTGRNASEVIAAAKRQHHPQVLWASCREPYHFALAQMAGCHIITMPPDMIRKMQTWWGMPLEAVADLTLEQFAEDRVAWT